MPGFRHPDKIKGQVLAGIREGKTLQTVAAETNVPYRTAADWVQRAREKALAEHRDPMLTDGEYRVAFLAQQINERQLEHLTTKDGDELLKWMVPTNILRGTAIDKVFKSKESRQPNFSGPITIILNAHPSDIVDSDSG